MHTKHKISLMNETKWFQPTLKVQNFSLSVFNFFGNISESFEFQKFGSHNMKVLAKDRKVNIAATNNLVFCHWQAFSAKSDIK
jgi:hypothetical protein